MIYIPKYWGTWWPPVVLLPWALQMSEASPRVWRECGHAHLETRKPLLYISLEITTWDNSKTPPAFAHRNFFQPLPWLFSLSCRGKHTLHTAQRLAQIFHKCLLTECTLRTTDCAAASTPLRCQHFIHYTWEENTKPQQNVNEACKSPQRNGWLTCIHASYLLEMSPSPSGTGGAISPETGVPTILLWCLVDSVGTGATEPPLCCRKKKHCPEYRPAVSLSTSQRQNVNPS